MGHEAAAFAKLAGVSKAIRARLDETPAGQRPIGNFTLGDVGPHFDVAVRSLDMLRHVLPDLYGDYVDITQGPDVSMMGTAPGLPAEQRFSRDALARLGRRIEEILEMRAHSSLATPIKPPPRKVFISHGSSKDWYEIQAHVEKDLSLKTLELAQEASKGMTVLGKLVEYASHCDSAVIVMTGDDETRSGEIRARENVIHEIGYFQGIYGLARVVLLHEDGVNIPSNIQGVVYVPFPKGYVSAGFGALDRELRAMYDSYRSGSL